MRLTLAQAREATQGSVLHAQRFPPTFSIVTDTRTLEKNDVYLALRGERFDGHDFVGQAYRQGAAAAIVDRVPEQCEEIPCIVVGDTKAAYMDLARAARKQFAGRVVALTGSTGKTTTKTFLGCMLAPHYGDRVAATPGNENNEIGVSKLLLSVQPDAEVVIVEMGARHYHDIAVLVEIARPEVAILTNVGEAHLQIMGSLERLAQTKWEIFQTGALPILNWNDPVCRAKCASLVRQPRWFAAGEDFSEENLPEHLTVVTPSSLSVRLGNAREEVSTEVTIPGAHNLSNVAAAAAAALAVNVPTRTIAAAISTLKLPSGRYETIQIEGRARIIYDAYNA
ncbi:MAG: Mur ligase family protein, partial [Candidatus Eremiobacteraeota bacterium]|nr:Mur ligase family protein [Candidatus Eremiobacteraeota bacterium]